MAWPPSRFRMCVVCFDPIASAWIGVQVSIRAALGSAALRCLAERSTGCPRLSGALSIASSLTKPRARDFAPLSCPSVSSCRDPARPNQQRFAGQPLCGLVTPAPSGAGRTLRAAISQGDQTHCQPEASEGSLLRVRSVPGSRDATCGSGIFYAHTRVQGVFAGRSVRYLAPMLDISRSL